MPIDQCQCSLSSSIDPSRLLIPKADPRKRHFVLQVKWLFDGPGKLRYTAIYYGLSEFGLDEGPDCLC